MPFPPPPLTAPLDPLPSSAYKAMYHRCLLKHKRQTNPCRLKGCGEEVRKGKKKNEGEREKEPAGPGSGGGGSSSPDTTHVADVAEGKKSDEEAEGKKSRGEKAGSNKGKERPRPLAPPTLLLLLPLQRQMVGLDPPRLLTPHLLLARATSPFSCFTPIASLI